MMKLLGVVVVLAGVLVSASGVDARTFKGDNDGAFSVVPGAYIVEMEPGSNVKTTLLGAMGSKAVRTRRVFNSPIFTGASVTLSNPNDVDRLKEIPHVRAVRPVTFFDRPEPLNKYVPSSPKDPKLPVDTFSTHKMTGVDLIHAQGFAGEGIKIGIVDTGIDYTHPALGGGFGPGHKVAGGTDLVGDNYDGGNTPVPDPDPLDQCAGHGTHVAGIIGATPGNEYKIQGVAYNASLYSYRVFGCQGGTGDDILAAALLQARSDGMDVITMSLGAPKGWTESTISVIASRMSDEGFVITIAAGNDGTYGAFFTSSPGNSISSMSVASVQNIAEYVIQSAVVSGADHNDIPYYIFYPLPWVSDVPADIPIPIYVLSLDTTIVDDGCNPLPDDTPDLSPYVVVVRRGTCSFSTKLTNIAEKKGKWVFIYNNEGVFGPIDIGNFTTGVLIPASDGEFLVQQYAQGVNITIIFPRNGAPVDVPNQIDPGLVSDFSSYGPTNDMYFKPSLAAPGGIILSTLPMNGGAFGIAGGTSMATPFVAGSAALLLQIKGKSAATEIRTLLQTTAKVVSSSLTDSAPVQTLAQQGAGLIQVYNAAHTSTFVTPAELLLNDTANFNGVHTITIENRADEERTYTLSHTPAGTAITLIPGTPYPQDWPVPLDPAAAGVSFDSSTITIPGGCSDEVEVTFTLPTGLDPATLPVYSGFIDIKTDNDAVHVAYLGVAGPLKEATILDTTDRVLGVQVPFIVNQIGEIQFDPANFTFVDGDNPRVILRLIMGTALIQIDLVRADFTLADLGNGTFADVPTIGEIREDWYIPRTNDDPVGGWAGITIFSSSFANGTAIPDGTYRLLFRALHIAGDPVQQSDYDAVLTIPFGKYSNATSQPAR